MQLFCGGRCMQKTEREGLSGAEGTESLEAGSRRTVLCDSRRLRVFLSAADAEPKAASRHCFAQRFSDAEAETRQKSGQL